MGRQKGQSARTKGNVQPSNSSRAAKLLSTGNAATFETFSGELSYVPVSSLKNDETGLPAEFRLVLTKLSKKDATTKLKALSELVELCKENDCGVVVQMLPFWSRHFNRFCYEKDRRVREAGQIAMLNLAKTCGKEIAPYLKAFIGWWWIAQNDFYSLAAKAAEDGFSIAFPTQDKQSKALMFCREEIMKLIEQNLFVTDLRQLTGTEKDDDFAEQLLACSLKAFAAFIKAVSMEPKNGKAKEAISLLLENKRFWKFQKNKNCMVKRVYYQVLTEASINMSELLKPHMAVVHKSIFHQLYDKDPMVMRSIWTCAYHASKNFPEWYEYVDIRAGFLPQLCKSIENAFSGAASHCGKILPSIVAHFPPSCRETDVYKRHFMLLSTTLDQHPDVGRNATESKVLVTTIVECYEYVMTADVMNDEDVIEVCVDTGLVSMLRNCVRTRNSNRHVSKNFYSLFVHLLRKLSSDNRESTKKFSDHLWCRIKTLACEVIDDLPSDFGSTTSDSHRLQEVNNLVQFFDCFRKITSSNDKSTYKQLMTKAVKFAVADAGETTENKCKPDETAEPSEDLFNCLRSIFHHVIKKDSDQDFPIKLYILKTIFTNFLTAQLFDGFMDLQQKPTIRHDNSGKDDALCFLINYFLPLLCQQEEANNDELLFDFVFNCFRCCQDDTGLVFLDELYSTECNVSKWCKLAIGERLLALPDHQHPALVTWLTSPQNKMAAHLLAAEASCHQEDQFWRVLKLALKPRSQYADECKLNRAWVVSMLKRLDVHHYVTEVLELVNACLLVYTCHGMLVKLFLLYRDCLDMLLRSEGDFSANMPQFESAIQLLTHENLASFHARPDSSTADDADRATTQNFFHETALLVKKRLMKCQFEGDDAARVVVLLYKAYKELDFPKHDPNLFLLSLLPDLSACSKFNHTSLARLDDIIAGRQLYLDRRLDAQERKVAADAEQANAVRTWAEVCGSLMRQVEDASVLEAVKGTAVEMLYWEITDDEGWLSESDELSRFLIDRVIDGALAEGNGWSVLFGKLLTRYGLDPRIAARMDALISSEKLTTSTLALNAFLVYSSHLSDAAQLKRIADGLRREFALVEPREDNAMRAALLLNAAVTLPIGGRHAELLDKVRVWRLADEDADLAEQSDATLHFGVAALKLFEATARWCESGAGSLTGEQWDFMLCSTTARLQSIEHACEQRAELNDMGFHALLHGSCAVMSALDSYLRSSHAHEDPSLPAALVSEWREFYACAAHRSLLAVYFNIGRVRRFGERTLAAVGALLVDVSRDTLLESAASLAPHLVPGSTYDDNVQTLLHHLRLRLTPDAALRDQLLAYQLLDKLMCHNLDRPVTAPPFVLLETLAGLSTSVAAYFDRLAALEQRRAAAHKRLRLSSESSSSSDEEEEESDEEEEVISSEGEDDTTEADVVSFLLAWKLLLRQISFVMIEERHRYVARLSEHGLSVPDHLLPRLMLVLPRQPTYASGEEQTTSCFRYDVADGLRAGEAASATSLLDRLACLVYMQLLQSLPAMARGWYQQLDKCKRAFIEPYTSEHVTPVLARRELAAVAATQQQQQPDGLEIQTRMAAREVIAAYRISDAEFEISVHLPPGYPLEPVKLDTVKRSGIPVGQWRYWILQMTTLLHQQNGTILDALLLWQRKVEKRLDGVEECMICFSVVHGGGNMGQQSLPKLACKTCGKKYHAECLYKWFDTSNQSTCPLCRSPMTFR